MTANHYINSVNKPKPAYELQTLYTFLKGTSDENEGLPAKSKDNCGLMN